MDFYDEDEVDHEHDDTFPLVSARSPSPTRASQDHFLPKYISILCYLTVFVLDIGAVLQEAPRTQIWESILCKEHYYDISLSGKHGSESGNDLRCKDERIQSQLAMLRGMQQLFDCLPAILLAVPYSMMANKYGRRPFLVLSLLGMTLGFAWVQVVCWNSDILDIRLIWLSSAFYVVGGGPVVANSLIYVLMADVVPESSRTNEFYRLEASGLIASVIGPALTSALMQRNLWLPMLLGLAIMFMGTCMASIIPEKSINLQDSIHLTTDSVGLDEPLPTEPAITGRWKANADTLKSTLRTMTQNKQVVLLLCISFTAQLGAGSRELLLQYVSKRYDWTFARANFLMSLRALVQLALLILLLPYASYLLLSRLSVSPYTKDLYLARTSAVFLVMGSFVVGISSRPILVAIGITTFVLGLGIDPLCRSLLTPAVSPRDISVLYTLMTLLQTIGISLAGPLYSLLFSKGMALPASIGIGLPFFVSSGLFVVVLSMLAFVG